MIQSFNSNGKLLITSEYFVLDGAKALALPTKFGQDLVVKTLDTCKGVLNWKSIDAANKTWFTCQLELPSLKIISNSKDSITKTLQKILIESKKLNPNFLRKRKDINVITNLSFHRNWGLGTSSTLINNIANWANINAFELQFKIFGGSAYDIACAQNNTAILYQLNDKIPKVETVDFNPPFKEQLYFVYLNKKQNSRQAIERYRKFKGNKEPLIAEISNITNQISRENSVIEFEKLIKNHEQLISKVIAITPIQKLFFNDYFGQIKSLGAWGGDFILATGNDKTPTYFKTKGFNTVIPYSKIILEPFL